MAESISKTQRWLDVISYLVGRRFPVPVEEIMANVPAYAERWLGGGETERATVRRTFERDKDELRRMGIPLETVPYTLHFGAETLEGYRIARRDFYLPYLRLLREREPERSRTRGSGGDPMRTREVEIPIEDAQLALDALWSVARLPGFPLAREAKSALRKIAFDIEDDASLEFPVIFAEPSGAKEVEGILRDLSDALLDRKRVRFRYFGIIRNEVTQRDVSPYGLFFREDWYLVGEDATRGAVRVFRVARIRDLEIARKRRRTPDYEVPDDFRLTDYVDREAWELGDDADEGLLADVRFTFPRALWAERNRLGELVQRDPDGSQLRRFEVKQVDAFLRWVLGMAEEAEVIAPRELRNAYSSMALRVLGLHGSGDGDG